MFFLVVGVEVVLGPVNTLAVFKHKNHWKELRRPLTVAAILQVAALLYGFRIVHAVGVPVEL